MSDLHAILLAAVEHRLGLARAAQNAGRGEWSQFDPDREPGLIQDERGEVVTYDEGRPTEGQAAFIAANDPATILRHAEADLRRLERHAPKPWGSWLGTDRAVVHGYECSSCLVDHDPTDPECRDSPVVYPCVEIADLAAAYAVALSPTPSTPEEPKP